MNQRAVPRAQKGFWVFLPKLLAMLAIAAQVLVLQPHVHVAAHAAFDDTAPIAISHDEATPSVVDCVVCRIGAANRAFAPPAQIEAPTPAFVAEARLELARAEATVAATSHSWRSRAPPVSLT